MGYIRAFFKWWIEELARVVAPLAVRRGAPAPYVLVYGDGRYQCLKTARKGAKELGVVDVDAVAGSKLLKRLKNQNVELRLDKDVVLDKDLTLPAAGQQYVQAILRHQIERLAPWAVENVAFDYVVGDSKAPEGQVAIRLVATSKETVAAALAPLEGLGVKPRRIGTTADSLIHPSPIDLQGDSKSERQTALRRVVAVTVAAAVAVILMLGGYESWQVYEKTLESDQIQQALDARRAVIAAAVARTTESDEYRELSARKQSAMPMVVLLNRLTTTIPDDTYLTELEVEGPTVRINGMSDAAPALISLLEKDDVLIDARFAAPTTRTEKGDSDRFQIVVKVAPPEPAD